MGKKRKISKKQLNSMVLRDKTAGELLQRAKEIERQLKRSRRPFAAAAADMKMVIESVDLAEKRLQYFRDNIKDILLQTVKEADKNADKLQPEIKAQVEKIKESLEKYTGE